MIDKLKSLGLVFKAENIAVNGNKFRCAFPTKEFWDFYDHNKQAMKEAGFSIYKESENGFLVYDWSNHIPATPEERRSYSLRKSGYEKKQLQEAVDNINILMDLNFCYRKYQGKRLLEMNSWNDLMPFLKMLFPNPTEIYSYVMANKSGSFIMRDE